MAKEFARGFYRSKAWLACRAAYIAERIKADGGMCEECGELPGYIVHHKVPLTPANIHDPEIALNPINLEYVCKACHDEKDAHFVKKGAGLLCAFDAHGQPIPPDLMRGSPQRDR